ncbi:DNA polymerase III subunit delta' [Parasporobacterium paucivorans]|uniref:DNA polymerase III subunit delta' n=1 Tax=Parasporobacterium paucivorans DSM 15970 TaxID=1122934 RepID=A0A1M6L5R4_9FIRM|nr:DNA polymerase III subunit delta' [Parasporobacterium paucivorans]SHJ66532.1 DNA polymerase-3 subunit delta' [Parasporobacterium paucivorans DSM 15970]
MPGFNDVLGNKEIISHIRNTVKTDKVSHAYIISGEKGMGKKLIASLFAMALLCEGNGDRPCMECRECGRVESGNHPDILWVSHEKPGSIGVEEIRRQLNSTIEIKPYEGKYKIYIIDEAEKLTVQAQNSLLKTIEEPPAYAVIFLLTTNPDILLPTIVSRCVSLKMQPVENELLKEHLIKQTGISRGEAEVIVSFSGGNAGKAMEIASSEAFNGMKEFSVGVLRRIMEMDVHEITLAAKNFSEYKNSINDCIDIIMIWFRDVLLFKVTNDLNELIFKDEYRYISAQASKASYSGLEMILESVDKARNRLRANVNFELTMELLLLAVKENIT